MHTIAISQMSYSTHPHVPAPLTVLCFFMLESNSLLFIFCFPVFFFFCPTFPPHPPFHLYRSTGFSEVIVVVGGCERIGGFNLPYTECYDPVTGEWKSLAKLPEFTKSEYAVCALRNDILVSGRFHICYQ